MTMTWRFSSKRNWWKNQDVRQSYFDGVINVSTGSLSLFPSSVKRGRFVGVYTGFFKKKKLTHLNACKTSDQGALFGVRKYVLRLRNYATFHCKINVFDTAPELRLSLRKIASASVSKVEIFFVYFKFLQDISPFCGATDTPLLVLVTSALVIKARWIPCLRALSPAVDSSEFANEGILPHNRLKPFSSVL